MVVGHERPASVLLVDDEDCVRQITARTLERLGYDVVQAADAGTALEVLARGEHDFKLVLSDVRMPGMSGDELARTVTRQWPAIPVLLMSGHAFAEDLTDGGVSYQLLRKPYSRAQLAEAIETVLNQPR